MKNYHNLTHNHYFPVELMISQKKKHRLLSQEHHNYINDHHFPIDNQQFLMETH